MACRTLARLRAAPRSLTASLHPRGHVTTASPSPPPQQQRPPTTIVHSPYREIEIPNRRIPDIVWESVDKYPDSTALTCGVTGQTYTYAQVQTLSLRLAASLRRVGLQQGETLALVLPNCPDFPVIVLGALEAGLAVSFCNHIYTADEMCHQLKDSGSVFVVTGAAQLATVLSAVSKVEQAVLGRPVRGVVVMDIPAILTLLPGVTRYSEMIADGLELWRAGSCTTDVHKLALLPYSSGTTGLPKGVCLSHRNIVANTLQLAGTEGSQHFPPGSDHGQDIMLGILPFYHISGLVVIMLHGLRSGAKIVTLPKFDQDTFVKTLENEKISIMWMVPPLILFMGSSARVTSKHLQDVRRIYSAAAPLGASDMERVNDKLPYNRVDITSQAYGMTETSPTVTLPTRPTKNLATVGAPVPNTLGKIIDPNTGEALGPHQSGELCFKGPQVMLGYHKNAKATADMIDAEGWLRTGDIGYYDEDNHFYVQDRLKELIKVKGFQVPPAELEEVLRTHPLVGDVGVVGVPDSRSGEVPVAYVVPKDGKRPTEEQIKEFLSEKLSRHKQVSRVIFIDVIPKSAAGKILRKQLRELYKK